MENTPKEKPKISRVGCLVWIAVLILICFCIASCGDEGGEKTNSEPSKLEAYVMSQQFVENQLKAPSTAKFPGFQDGFVKEMGDNKYKISAYVDAENSFGAKIRVKYFCVLKYVGDDNWQLEDVELKE